MSGNRFEFLEIDETGGASKTGTPQEASEPVVVRGPEAPVMPDGMPLAQVRITDPRGYHTFLEQSTDYTEPGSRQRSGTSEGSRLRLAEVFGSRGSKAGQFSSPTGLAVDPAAFYLSLIPIITVYRGSRHPAAWP